MQEAYAHGVNAANVRGEIQRMTLSQLSEPDTSDLFVRIAEIVREDSLHLIAGGFWTDTTSTAYEHNDSVLTYLDEYSYSTSGIESLIGDFIGVFGFDEPDARYEGPSWENCEYNTEWYDLVDSYADSSRSNISEDIKPFGTFLDRWSTEDTLGNKYYRETIPLFCGELDYPVFDRYPCQFGEPVNDTFPDLVQFDTIIGSTNLIPSDSVDYYAYADQDEIFAVDRSGWLRIYEFVNVTSRTTPISVSAVDSILLPASLRSDPVWASSDFRSSDVGDRGTGYHRLNGAVVFFDGSDPDENMAVFHDGDNIIFLEDSIHLPDYTTEITSVCVGEYNYPEHHPTPASRRGSVISRGDLRILVCYQAVDQEVIVDSARVFAWDYTNEEFDDVTSDSLGIPLDFTPAGSVWGVFWPSDNEWDPEDSDDASGFIVYDSTGHYHNIYEYTPQGTITTQWRTSDEYDNLFALDDTWFLSRQTYLFPCFVAGMDYLCHLRATHAIDEAVLEFASSPGSSPSDSLTVFSSAPIELPRSFHFGDINDAASCRPLRSYDDALLVSFDIGSGGSEVYGSTSHINFRGQDNITITLEKASDEFDTLATDEHPLLTSTRVYNVRYPYRGPIAASPIEGVYPSLLILINSDIPVEDPWEIMFSEQHVSLDTMFVYGIDSTSRENCLMHNLRCEGRRQDGQLTFYPSPDTLLYLMTTSLVHGCRGVHLRALDLTMRCGNGGRDVPSGTYRCPDLMLNWGPSVETTNPDMIGRMLDVVQSMTGKNTSNPDFMSALISDEWTIMDLDDAENAKYDELTRWDTDTSNDSLNFISLIESSSNDILLLAVNDSPEVLDDSSSDSYFIHFPDRNALHYTVHYIAGDSAYQMDVSPDLAVSFYGMPAYTASLYWFERD